MSATKRYFSPEHAVVTPTVTEGAYSANDVIGGLLTFAFSEHNTGGLLGTLRIRDNDAVGPAMVLYLFDKLPDAELADNAAFALTDADSDALIATITLGTWKDFTAFKWIPVDAVDDDTGKDIDFRTGDGNLYVYAKVTGTPTMTNADALSFDWVMWGD